MKQPNFVIKLYGRPGCHLCDEVEKRIRRVAEEIPVTLHLVNITDDIKLEEKYMLTIPVVEIDGDEVFPSITTVMTEEQLVQELRRRVQLEQQ